MTDLWSGSFGDEYTTRNVGRVATNTAFFARALRRASGIRSVVELGCGAGENLVALNRLLPDVKLYGVEVNEKAASMVPVGEITVGSLLDVRIPECSLSFTKGCLIHIPPKDLANAYDQLYHASSNYILVAEYHNPKPVEVEYRGEMGRMWKREFAGDMLDRYPDLRIVDYGFTWSRDPLWPQDSLLWVLMQSTSP